MAKSAKQCLIKYEASTTEVKEALTSDDGLIYTSSARVWSINDGKEITIIPDGVSSGLNMTSPHTDENKVAVEKFSLNLGGEELTVDAQDVEITRASTGSHVKNILVVGSDKNITAIKGTEGTEFSAERGAAGGPPEVPTDKIQIAEVALSSQDSAVISKDEIRQSTSNNTQERADVPVYQSPNTTGDGTLASSSATVDAYVEFIQEIPAIHAGATRKAVWAEYQEPVFAEVEESSDWEPAEESYSGSSKGIYRKALSSESSSLGDAQFTIYLDDAVNNPLRKLRGQRLTFMVFPSKYEEAHMITQGRVGFDTAYPAEDVMSATVKIVSPSATVDKSA